MKVKSVLVFVVLYLISFFCTAQTAIAPTSGDGSASNPYQIASLENLYWIASNPSSWDKSFIQTADIDATETSTWFSGAGWLPIGDLQNSWAYPPLSPFTGKYNGQGFDIVNLFINRPTTKGIGLFGSTRNTRISNVNIINANITGGEGTAGICGATYIGDTIDYCYTSGTISGARCVGGITGNVFVPDGYPTGYIRVAECYSEANISGNTECGGIVGRMSCTNLSPAEIINSYARGSVSVTTNWVGGLVGYFYSGGKVRNCYSTGSVSGPTSGGMVGYAGNSTWTNCFWDTQTSGQASSARGTGKTTAEMILISTFTDAGWDFQCETINGVSDYWGQATVLNSGYPFLSFTGEISDNCDFVWQGDDDSDWNNDSNWNTGRVPDLLKAVIIPATSVVPPEISGYYEVSSLEIEAGAECSILPSSGLTIYGNLDNEGVFNLMSSATGEGSLIVDGSLLGSGTYNVERYLTASQWHLVSSPITAGTAGVFHGIWLRSYDESTNSFGEYIVSDATPMPTGQGFSVWAPSAQTRMFSGTVNHGTIGPVSVQLTGAAGPNTGWNLIGNPYPSAIDWDAASGWSRTNISDAVYVWNGTQYATYVGGIPANGGSRYIAPTQGFFVQATSSGASIGMDNGIRLHNGVNYLKETTEPMDIVRISIVGNGFSDETVLAVRSGALNVFDPTTDAIKLTGSSEAPSLYTTKDDDSELTISCLNSVADIVGKNLNISYAFEGEHVMNWTHSIQSGSIPVLYDNIVETVIPPDQPYTYLSSFSDPDDRFSFIEMTKSELFDVSCIYSNVYNNCLRIFGTANSDVVAQVYNVQGQKVLEFIGTEYNVDFLSAGVYLIRITTDNKEVVEKLVIK